MKIPFQNISLELLQLDYCSYNLVFDTDVFNFALLLWSVSNMSYPKKTQAFEEVKWDMN